MRNRKFKSIFGICLIWVFIFSACQETDKKGRKLDNPTSGNIKICIDETLVPLFNAELETFHNLYTRAHINPAFVPEAQSIKELINDSVKVIFTTRQLNEEEKKYFKDIKIPVTTTKVAYDAVALIVNNQNADSVLTLAQLSDILHGKIKTWNGINPAFSKEKIQVVFDHSGSSTVNYMKNYFKLGDSLPDNFFAMHNNTEVLKYVEQNKSALGIIGVGWICDRQDSATIKFMENIKVLGLSPPDTIDADQPYYQPYQAYIALRYYPLVREVYSISREARAGLGTGFVSFVAGTKGQTIVRLSGLLPATMPVRLINVKKKF